MKRMIALLLLALSLATLALVPEQGQTVGSLSQSPRSPYWVARVISNSLAPGDRVSIRRNGRELCQARVIEVSGEQAMLTTGLSSAQPARGDQVVWLGHGAVVTDPSHPPLPTAVTPPARRAPAASTMATKYGDQGKQVGQPQSFSPPTFQPPTAPTTTFNPPGPPSTTFQGPAFQPPTSSSTTFQPPQASSQTFTPPSAPGVVPGPFGVTSLSKPTPRRVSTLPQDIGMLDSRGQKVIFQKHKAKTRVVIAGKGWPLSDTSGLKSSVRDAQIGKSSTRKLGEVTVKSTPNRLLMRAGNVEAAFEGDQKLSKLERVLSNWR